MASSLFSPVTSGSFPWHLKCCFSPHTRLSSLHKNRLRCSFSPEDIPVDFVGQSLSHYLPAFNDTQKWASLGLVWFYLTARPGVLVGAIDAYLLAPLQLGLDTLIGTRRFKRSDFLVTEKLGEGSFGVVYSGVLLPKNSSVDEARLMNKATLKSLVGEEFKERVILKQVKLGVRGAQEFGEFEEWFNYRLSRAAPDTCAEFLGSFVADKTNTMFTKGGKWLVWRFEGDRDLADYMKDRTFPSNLESIMFGRVLQGVESVKRRALIIK